MKKTIFTSALLAIAGVGLVAGNAIATPVSADYWTHVDDSVGSNFTFQLTGGNAAWVIGGGTFGFYDVINDDISTPVLDHEIEMLNGSVFDEQAHFSFDGTDWRVDLASTTGVDENLIFSNVFGFWFDQDGGDNTTGRTYTDAILNGGADPMNTSYNPDDATVSMNFTDGQMVLRMVEVTVHDVAPVPEPATMLLFGTGLVGLAGLRRRKSQKKA